MLPVSRCIWAGPRREAEEPGREGCGGVLAAVGICCAQLMTFRISFMAWRLRACTMGTRKEDGSTRVCGCVSSCCDGVLRM